MLLMKMPVVICNCIRAQLTIIYTTIDTVALGPWNVDNTIHDDMRNMNTLRAKFSSQRLSSCSKGEFTRREGSAICTAFQRRSRTSDEK